jgi:hypothetical protein
MTIAERGSGRARQFRVALIWVLQGLRTQKDKEPQVESTLLGLRPAVTGITIQCDGMPKSGSSSRRLQLCPETARTLISWTVVEKYRIGKV